MGAIFGIYDRTGRKVARCDLETMSASLQHRGADAAGVWHRGACGLGARLRFTTPESVFEQPPRTEDTAPFVIACDARLDNVEALTRLLDLPLGQVVDSRIIVEAYKKWGRGCVEHLLGDFAFALYDVVEDLFFCARDHFGVKPFYYVLSAERFGFASEPKALLVSGLVAPEIDESKTADYLLRNLHDKENTFYNHVLRLPPAHSLIVGRHTAEKQQYWRLTLLETQTPSTDQEYAERFRDIFTEAVRCRLRSAFPVGTFLSGGLDSSAVTLVAQRLLAQADAALPLPVFSAIFPDVPASDESRWIDIVLKENVLLEDRLDPHYFRADQVGALDVHEAILFHLDEPCAAVNLYHTWGMLDLARKAGVRVMLTGHDGDTVVSHGFAYLTELALAEKWDQLTEELSQAAEHLALYGNMRRALLRTYVQPCLGALWKELKIAQALRTLAALHRHFGLSRREMILNFLLPASIRQALQRLRRRGVSADVTEVNAAFRQSPVFRQRQAAVHAWAVLPCTVSEEHQRGLNAGIMTAAFEAMDKVSAAFGIECRHPFFDKRLVEFCLALPRDQKIKDGWTRLVLRNAMSGILPEAIQWRPGKSNLGHNFARSLLSNQALIDVILSEKNPCFEQYWDIETLKRTAQRYFIQPTEGDAITLFLAVGFATWCRSIIKSAPERYAMLR